jgi:hypothetical protein
MNYKKAQARGGLWCHRIETKNVKCMNAHVKGKGVMEVKCIHVAEKD